MNPASATAIFAVILLTASTGALSIQDVQRQQEYPADSHKKPCPAEYEEYCLNGGKCFTVTVAGITTMACQCVIGYSGIRCQSRSLNLDILFGNGPEKDVQGQQEYPADSHKKPCPAGYEEYCLNGGKCFTVTVAGITTRACQCVIGYSGIRCQSRSLNLDILFGNRPEKDVQGQQEYLADSHKKPCPAEYEEYCLNGGKCFTVTVAGITTMACQCVIGYSGIRCQSRSLNLDILFGNGPEKVDIAQHGDHTLPCPPGNEYHCLNGGTCFVVNLGGGRVSNRACHCTSEFTGRRCEYQNIALDLLGDLDWEPYHGGR